jgi:hypothetical protein
MFILFSYRHEHFCGKVSVKQGLKTKTVHCQFCGTFIVQLRLIEWEWWEEERMNTIILGSYTQFLDAMVIQCTGL